MIRNNNAVNVWLTFEAEHGREITKEEFIQMGYNKNYYYEVKKKVKQLKAAQVIKDVKVEGETLVFVK